MAPFSLQVNISDIAGYDKGVLLKCHAFPSFPLVPKLNLGTHLPAKLYFADWEAKYNFACNNIPKYNLGTRMM